MKEMGIDRHIRLNEVILGRIFGSSESIIVTDTFQSEDYSKYVRASKWKKK